MIETNDLLLRQGTTEDGPALHFNLWQHAEVFRYMFSHPSPDEAAGINRTAAYAGMHTEVPTEFFVCDKHTGTPIGIAGVKELKPGYWTITDIAIGPAYQGRGYGKQVIHALLNLAFNTYSAQVVAYDCFAQNEASKHLALTCGFTYDHSETAELQKNGEPVTLDYYIIRK